MGCVLVKLKVLQSVAYHYCGRMLLDGVKDLSRLTKGWNAHSQNPRNSPRPFPCPFPPLVPSLVPSLPSSLPLTPSSGACQLNFQLALYRVVFLRCCFLRNLLECQQWSHRLSMSVNVPGERKKEGDWQF